jgi:hypothetical protein
MQTVHDLPKSEKLPQSDRARLEILVDKLQPNLLATVIERSLTAVALAAAAHTQKSCTYSLDTEPKLKSTDFITGVVRDHDVLEALLGDHWQRNLFGKKVGSATTQELFEASFLLRHAATWVALTWKQHHRASEFIHLDAHCGSPYSINESALRTQAAAFLNSTLFLESRKPQIALSARGIEWAVIPESACSHFDPYAGEPCWGKSLTRGGSCANHVGHDWGHASYQSGLRQMSTMRQSSLFAFYGNISNLRAYSEDELNELIQAFWKRMSRFKETNTDLNLAALELGYRSLSDAIGTGIVELKNRFRIEARRVHPDAGGAAAEFQRIERAYRALLDAMAPVT